MSKFKTEPTPDEAKAVKQDQEAAAGTQDSKRSESQPASAEISQPTKDGQNNSATDANKDIEL